MNLDDIKQILDLVREHDLAEFELERDGLKVRVRKAGSRREHRAAGVAGAHRRRSAGAGRAAASAAGAVAGRAGGRRAPPSVDLAVIKSPIVGTFYRAPEPGAPTSSRSATWSRRGRCSASSKR